MAERLHVRRPQSIEGHPKVAVHVAGPRAAASELAAFLAVALIDYQGATITHRGELRWRGRYSRYTFELEVGE